MKSRKNLIASCLVTLLPVLVGILLWEKLPMQIPTHFNFAGEADGFSSKFFAVFILPLFILALHLVVAFALKNDPKSSNISDKISSLVLWICPVISLFMMGICYSSALMFNVPASKITLSLVGVLFILIGNYLPKCQLNYTCGIKTPWTLNNEYIWQKTHRMAGPLWILGGFLMILVPFLGKWGTYLFIAVTVALVFIPVIYSYKLYKEGK